MDKMLAGFRGSRVAPGITRSLGKNAFGVIAK